MDDGCFKSGGEVCAVEGGDVGSSARQQRDAAEYRHDHLRLGPLLHVAAVSAAHDNHTGLHNISHWTLLVSARVVS